MSWPEAKLSEIGTISTGNTPSKQESIYYDSNDYPFIKPDLLNKNEIVCLSSSKEFVSAKGAEKARIASAGSVLVTCIGNIGNIGIVQKDVCFNQQINAIAPFPEVALSKYVAYAILFKKRSLEALANAAVVPIINKTEFSKFKIPLPPLEVQKKIAAVLEKADELRHKREEQIKRLDDLLQATFLDMFGDPVTNPKGWPVSNLEEIGEITTGSTPPTKEKNMFDGEIPFITPGDLKESWVSAARTVTEDGAKKSRTVMKGATLVCCIGATIGKMGKAAEYAAFNQQINAISWGSLVEHNFGLEMMKFFKQKIALAGASTTLPILNKGLFKKISIPVPPLTLQNSFSKIIHSIEIQKKFFLEQLKTSNNLFASLMQRAFKGELELK